MLILIFDIFKGLILLDDLALTDILLNSFFIDTLGVFECTSLLTLDNPESSHNPLKCPYRTFIERCTRFHNVLELEDKEVLKLIEERYRLSFFRDAVIVEWMGEQAESIFNRVWKALIRRWLRRGVCKSSGIFTALAKLCRD
eukprot:TRINITY_DN3868_c0_g4_i2.p3 TRINITY_DN3868_c0_g4~~TRINITY_DN3868_c0_g4_i2.p3  ORF type:complete len:142 (-),score=36.32 TRINITY_DN3868_c0_g4_i2:1275-1700(-)